MRLALDVSVACDFSEGCTYGKKGELQDCYDPVPLMNLSYCYYVAAGILQRRASIILDLCDAHP